MLQARAMNSATWRPQPQSGLQLCLVGQATLKRGDGTLHALAVRDALLLGRLAQDGPQDRQHLAGWLWPDTAPAQARTNLRQRLLRLRRVLGRDLVQGGTRLALDPALPGDWQDPQSALRTDPQALRGDWLGALTGLADTDLETWLTTAREHWHAQCHTALLRCADEAQRYGDANDALPFLRRLCAEDPLHEGHHRRLMQWHLDRSEPGGALAVYARLARRLREELGLLPHPQTAALARLAGDPGGSGRGEAQASPGMVRVGRPGAPITRVPCFDGTAVPVRRLFDVLQSGAASLDDFLQRHPSVSRPAALAVLRSAQARWLDAPLGP